MGCATTTHEIVSETDPIVEIYPCHAKLARKQHVIEGPQRRARRVAHVRSTVARNTVRLPEHVCQASLLHNCDVRRKLTKVASDERLGHEVLQDARGAETKRAAVVVLRDPASDRVLGREEESTR